MSETRGGEPYGHTDSGSSCGDDRINAGGSGSSGVEDLALEMREE